MRGHWVAVALALGYFIAAFVGHLSAFDTTLALARTVWPASGLYLAALLLTRPRHWALLIVAAAVGNATAWAMVGAPNAVQVAILVTSNAIEAIFGLWVLRSWFHYRGGPPTLSHVTDVAALSTAALLGPALGASFTCAVLWATAEITHLGDLALLWRQIWSADLLGIVLLTPAVLVLVRAIQARRRRVVRVASDRPAVHAGTATEAALIIVSLTASSLLFWLPPPLPPMLFLPLLPLGWAALRFGALGGTLGPVVLAALATAGTIDGRGSFASFGEDLTTRVTLLQLYLAAAAIACHAYVALDAERRRATRQSLASGTALSSTRAYLDLALKAAGMGTWHWDTRNNRIEWDEQQFALYGVPPEGRKPPKLAEIYARIHPDDVKSVRSAVEAVMNGTSAVVDMDYRVRHPDGTVRWLHTYAAIFADDTGKPPTFAGLCHDVTDRYEAREQLERLNATLEARVQALVTAREVEQRRAAHSERLASLGQLAGGVGHDVNNCLQTILSSAHLIARRAADPAIVERFIRPIIEAATHGAGFTRRLLAFSRRDALHPEPIETEPFIRESSRMLGSTLGSAIHMQVHVHPDTPPMLVDKAQLESTLASLVSNARDAMVAGGTVKITAHPFEVAQTAPLAPTGTDVVLPPGRYVRLDVSDEGHGMDSATLAQVADPFFTTKGAGKGNGMGIPIAKGFAEQSGGALAIHSVLGEGTTVTLWLPAADPVPIRAEADPEPDALAPDGRTRPRVLLVDDEDLVRQTLGEELRLSGFDVDLARDAHHAREQLAAGAPVDILITDFSMPGMNGMGLIDAARQLRPGLPAILLTGFAGPIIESARSSSIKNSFVLLQKPVRGTQLAAQAAKVLRRPPPAARA